MIFVLLCFGVAKCMIRDELLNATYVARSKGQKKIDWSVYQLSDAFRLCLLEAESLEFRERREILTKVFPGSIVAEILNKHKTLDDAYGLLDESVRRRLRKTKRRSLPSPDSLTVHLRVGDVLDDPALNQEEDVFEYGSSPTVVTTNLTSDPKHPGAILPVYALSVYNTATRRVFEAVEMTLPDRVKTVNVLAYLDHSETDVAPPNHVASQRYRDSVIDFFRNRGYRISTRHHLATPDDDFVFIAASRFFLPSGGSYGGHACAIVSQLGGNCLRGATIDPLRVDMNPPDARLEVERIHEVVQRLKTQTIPSLKGDRYKSIFVWSEIAKMHDDVAEMLLRTESKSPHAFSRATKLE